MTPRHRILPFGTPVRRIAGVAVTTIVCATQLAAACPSCRDAAAAAGGGLSDGIGYTVCLMIAAPIMLLGLVASVIVRAVRRAADGAEDRVVPRHTEATAGPAPAHSPRS